jgi:LSD1 subclass zinc finger protein
MEPTTWTVQDVEKWAKLAGLSNDTIQALVTNDVDGPTLVTLSQSELVDELGIRSLPARRYLWDLVVQLKSEQDAHAGVAAVHFHEKEINDIVANKDSHADESSGSHPTIDKMVMMCLRNDATQQRQIYEDHILAHKMQALQMGGQQVYADSCEASTEQERLNRIHEQCLSDRQYALSLDPRGVHARQAAHVLSSRVQRHAVTTHHNASTAAKTSSVDNLKIARLSTSSSSIDSAVTPKISNQKSESIPSSTNVTITKCNVCYDENVKCFALACNHPYCVGCLTALFERAIKDTSLLPLQCCAKAIDMDLVQRLLKPTQYQFLASKLEEKQAKRKMFCPTCTRFINLDRFDGTETRLVECSCKTRLCIACQTKSHEPISCAMNQWASKQSNLPFDALVKAKGWKKCPGCRTVIELKGGCNHITCAYCNYQFCFNCSSSWNQRSGQCSSNQCAVWDEDRLIDAANERVNEQERRRINNNNNNNDPAAAAVALAPAVRAQHVAREMEGLRQNEYCQHTWVKRGGNRGNCERCGYYLPMYGMVCSGRCRSTVCHTCAQFRIPQRGWR